MLTASELDWLTNRSYDAIYAYLNSEVRQQGKRSIRRDTAAVYIAILRAFQEAGIPQTVRQLFYKLTAYRVIPKTENGYKQVGYHSLQMRKLGLIPYTWLTDNTRWMRKTPSYDSIDDFLRQSRDAYRRSIWRDQESYVEVWCEKDALAGVLHEITDPYDVPLMVTRGFSSATFAYEAAQTMLEWQGQGKQTFIYYFGDHDPSGKDIPRDLQKKLRSHGVNFNFELVAVLPEQITAWDLPTRPTKRTDSRSKNFKGESVELDAIPANMLRQLCRDVIEQHIEPYTLHYTKMIETLERETLETVLSRLEDEPDAEKRANKMMFDWLVGEDDDLTSD